MDSKKIKIRLTEDGNIFAETIGVKGKDCMAYIELLEQILDADTIDSDFTADYYETEIYSQQKQSMEEEWKLGDHK